jgi:hypothetical protein
MAFSIPKKAKSWFQYIQTKKGIGSGFELDFDIYYFCLMSGLSNKPRPRKEDLPSSETTEIIQSFPKEYQNNRHLIIALFIRKELERLGVSLKERKALDTQLKILINPTSPTSLSDKGMKELNSYVYGGFKVLQEYFSEPPRTLDDFLIGFCKMINKSEGKE